MARRHDTSGAEALGGFRLLKALGAVALAAALAACAVAPESEPVALPEESPKRPSAPLLIRLADIPEDGAESCDITVDTVWAEGLDNPDQVFMAEGKSTGVSCMETTLTLTLRSPTGKLIWRDELNRAQVLGFADADTPEKMRGRLIDWITQYGALNRTTRQLPDWPDGLARPDVGEGRPFLPARDLPRAEYEQLRQSGRPLYCYTASSSYLNCVSLDRREGEVRYLGVQTLNS